MNPGSAYRPGREIARGGMGAVLDARDPKLGRSVAMKVMLRRNATEEEKQRFLQEALALGQLPHPNIVPIHDLGTDAQGRLFYTMKLVQGVTLHEIIGKLKARDAETLARYPLDSLLTIFQKVCDAVAFAHSQGIIHRDLKPQNIMVGEFGEVLVMDWGLAKILPGTTAGAALARPAPGTGPMGTLVLTPTPAPGAPDAADTPTIASVPDSAASAGASAAISAPLLFTDGPDTPVTHLTGSQLTLDGTVMGTPNYMAPEQAAGRTAELDERADVYALGGLLYALLALRPPVEGREVNEVLSRVRHGDLTPPARLQENSTFPHLPDGRVPDALSAVAMQALALEPGERYRTVGELQAEVRAYQAGFATTAERAGALTQLRLFLRRHRVISAAAAVIALLAVAFIHRLARERDVAERNEAKAVAAQQEANANAKKAQGLAEDQRREAARARVLLADAAYLAADRLGMVQALDQCPEDLRKQNWHYLDAKRDTSLGALRVPDFEQPTAIAAAPEQPGVFALANGRGELGFIHAASSTILTQVKTGRGGIQQLAFAPNGRLLALARRGATEVDLHRVADGVRLRSIPLPQSSPHWIALFEHGQRDLLISVHPQPTTSRSTVRLTDAQSGIQLWEAQFPGYVATATMNPAGDRVAVCGGGQVRRVVLLNARDGRECARVEVYPHAVAFSPDGRRLAVGSVAGELLLIETETGTVVQRGRIHPSSLVSLAWLGDRHVLTTGSEGKFSEGRWLFRVVDTETLAVRGSFFGLRQGPNQPVWSAHPATDELLTHESPPRRWRFPVAREIARRSHTSEQAWGGVFVSSERLVARKSFGLSLYDERLVEQRSQPHWNLHLAASHPPSGQFALARHIRNEPPGLSLFSFTNQTAVEIRSLPIRVLANSLAFDAGGQRLLVATRDGAVEGFSLADGRNLFRHEGSHERAVFAGTNFFSLASIGTGTHTAHRLERRLAAPGGTVASLPGHSLLRALAITPDERLVAYAGSDRQVYFADAMPLPDGSIRERGAFRAHDGEIGALAFHPTQPILASASADGSVKLWHHRDMRQPLEWFLGLEGMPIALSFSPDGKRLLVDGQERTTRVYDVAHVTVPAKP